MVDSRTQLPERFRYHDDALSHAIPIHCLFSLTSVYNHPHISFSNVPRTVVGTGFRQLSKVHGSVCLGSNLVRQLSCSLNSIPRFRVLSPLRRLAARLAVTKLFT